jgi:hypothetical protein
MKDYKVGKIYIQKEINMDISKWKSVAIRIDDYKILKSLCGKKFRAPASMISKLVHDYCKYQASKEKVKYEVFIKNLLSGKNG